MKVNNFYFKIPGVGQVITLSGEGLQMEDNLEFYRIWRLTSDNPTSSQPELLGTISFPDGTTVTQ